MTNQATINKLIEMRLTTMANAFRIHLQDNTLTDLSFEDRIGLLVDIEYNSRKNNRLKRLIKKATFDQSNACAADINYSAGRQLNKSQIQSLSTCSYIAEKHNIIIMEPLDPESHIWPVLLVWKPASSFILSNMSDFRSY
jgi:hypothetical protein